MARKKGKQALDWYTMALIAPFSFRWDDGFEEKAAIQVLLAPTRADFDLHLTY
jgi:hypothetical protein